MTELQDKLRKALKGAGMSREAADEGAAAALREERRLNEQANLHAYARATALRDRDCYDPLRFDEAVEVYRMVRPLCRFGECKRVGGRENKNMRDALICWWLGILADCALPVTSHPDNQKTGKNFTDDARKKSLAMAMGQATGIGEPTILRVWSQIVQTRKNEAKGWSRSGHVFTKWLPPLI